jgi:hypothetical protein
VSDDDALSVPDDASDLGTETVDVDVLWGQLQAARSAGDRERVRAIEGRMRQLQTERRFAHLSDAELDERIRAISGEREPRNMLGHSPGGGPGGDSAGGEDILRLNHQIRANQHAGIEQTLGALLDERDRRRR